MYAKDARLPHRVACACVTIAMATSVFAALPTFALAEDEVAEPVEAVEVVEDVEEEAEVIEEPELTALAVEEPEVEPELAPAAPPHIGWYYDGTGWKYYDQSGNQVYGFVLSGGKYYYLEDEYGYMLENTTFTHKGTNYVCDENGVCPNNTWVKIGSFWYYTGTNHGNISYGWIKVNGKNYWMDDNGILRIGKFIVEGKSYVSDANGACMPNAWIKYGSEWYLTDSKCACRTGWAFDNGKWYYLDPENNGVMVTGWVSTDNYTYYYMADSGAMVTGWKSIAGDWYYFKDSGAMAVGWQLYNNKWYYLDPINGSNPGNKGAMISDAIFNDGKHDYIAKPSGECPDNEWVKYGGYWYRTDGNCMIRTYWYQVDGDWYFSNGDGKLLQSVVFSDPKGNLYIATSSGVCPSNKWVKLSGYWYYTDDNCMLHAGWLKYKDDWYYLDKSDGHMLANQYTPDGYWVDANGKWVKS